MNKPVFTAAERNKASRFPTASQGDLIKVVSRNLKKEHWADDDPDFIWMWEAYVKVYRPYDKDLCRTCSSNVGQMWSTLKTVYAVLMAETQSDQAADSPTDTATNPTTTPTNTPTNPTT